MGGYFYLDPGEAAAIFRGQASQISGFIPIPPTR